MSNVVTQRYLSTAARDCQRKKKKGKKNNVYVQHSEKYVCISGCRCVEDITMQRVKIGPTDNRRVHSKTQWGIEQSVP